MVTKNKFFYLIDRIPLAVFSLLVLIHVFHLQSLVSSQSSSLELKWTALEITKINASGDHHKKDSQDENLPLNENKPEEDSDEETKENKKENNNLSDYNQSKTFCIDTQVCINISKVYYLYFNNRKTLVPLYVLFHSWKDYLV